MWRHVNGKWKMKIRKKVVLYPPAGFDPATSGLDAITIPKSDPLLRACQRIRRRCFTAHFLCATGGKWVLLHCRYVANGSV